MDIIRMTTNDMPGALPDLAALLRDSVEGGASIGFLLPLSDADAADYWQEVSAALSTPYRILLAARQEGKIIGSVQLHLESRANGSHRAEVIKLMVHSSARRQGVAQALLREVEREALAAGRTTLVLDTREGDPSEQLYLKMGYNRIGSIPEYARSINGELHATVFLYKLLH